MKPVDNYQYDYMFEFVVLKYDQYLSLIPFCGVFSQASFSSLAAVIRFFLIRVSIEILGSTIFSCCTRTQSKTALKEQGSLITRSARILRLSLILELLRQLMNRLYGRFKSLVAAEIEIIQSRLMFLGRSFRPMQAFCKLFYTLGIASFIQFFVLPQKPLASFRYFCLLKPAIIINIIKQALSSIQTKSISQR